MGHAYGSIACCIRQHSKHLYIQIAQHQTIYDWSACISANPLYTINKEIKLLPWRRMPWASGGAVLHLLSAWRRHLYTPLVRRYVAPHLYIQMCRCVCVCVCVCVCMHAWIYEWIYCVVCGRYAVRILNCLFFVHCMRGDVVRVRSVDLDWLCMRNYPVNERSCSHSTKCANYWMNCLPMGVHFSLEGFQPPPMQLL